MPNALIFGITGFAGAGLARHLVAQAWDVRGIGRDEQAAPDLESLGVVVEIADVVARESLEDVGRDGDHVFYLVGSVAGNNAWVRRVGYDGVVNVCDALRDVRIASFTYVGTLAVYGAGSDVALTEHSPVRPNSLLGRVNVAAEQFLQDQQHERGLPVRIVRSGTIYGAGRDTLTALRQGRLRVIGHGRNYTSRIHVEDLARVLEAIALQGKVGEVYVAADDEPVQARAYYDYLAEAAEAAPPRTTRRWLARSMVALLGLGARATRGHSPLSQSLFSLVTASYRASNARIRSELGVELAYPTYREGVASMVAGPSEHEMQGDRAPG